MKLRGEFAVHLQRDGERHTFLPGDDVPEWAAKQIKNPLAWGEGEKAPEPTPAVVSDSGDGPPPQGGAGASRQRWADYATPLLAAKGVEVQEDWKREDIIAACEKAGVPV
ncbi:hypothetical protein AB0H71_13715 [Nocardia sp. NPDC050697]|uniref:hypothetical protein n=1 Tax=Nocardia sp. NPDC050697 TaxID=3155158 RepID=UPI003407B12D